MSKMSVNDFITFFIIKNDIEKYIDEYCNQYKQHPTKEKLLNFILVHIPLNDYTKEEQKQLVERLDFQLFNYFDDEQDHTEDIYDYLDLPPLKIS